MSDTAQDKSALVVLVPEAEPLVSTYRRQHDASARAGLGAHITVLFPFFAAEDLAPSVAAAFPEYPPYGGAFAAPVPHLTVAAKPPVHDLESVEEAMKPV